ncbi:Fic family protein [archaeon]|nr:Fic family protein [archaeon]
MEQIPEAGEFRKQNVKIKLNPSFKTSNWQNIKDKINNLIKKYLEFESKKRTLEEVITFAAFFHNEFQRIHPFIDGNSRISRLLMLHILRSHNLPLFDLPIGYFDSYLDLTKRSTKRDDIALKYLVEELVLINLKKVNRTIA